MNHIKMNIKALGRVEYRVNNGVIMIDDGQQCVYFPEIDTHRVLTAITKARPETLWFELGRVEDDKIQPILMERFWVV